MTYPQTVVFTCTCSARRPNHVYVPAGNALLCALTLASLRSRLNIPVEFKVFETLYDPKEIHEQPARRAECPSLTASAVVGSSVYRRTFRNFTDYSTHEPFPDGVYLSVAKPLSCSLGVSDKVPPSLCIRRALAVPGSYGRLRSSLLIRM